MTGITDTPKTFLCIAHRGASGHEPENTLPAFERALLSGADWIELDVYVVEEQLIVIHDETLERTTNGQGRVMEKSLAYLRSLDAGNGHPIPLLHEVFELVDGRCGLNIELKGPDTAAPVVDLIEAYEARRGGSYEKFLVSSFDSQALLDVKQRQAAITTGFITGRIPALDFSFVQSLGVASIHPHFKSFNPSLLHGAHQNGLRVFVYTVNHLADIQRLVNIGADGVFTDYPERVMDIRRQYEASRT